MENSKSISRISDQKKTALLESLRRLRSKLNIVSGGLTILPNGQVAFIFVDEKQELPKSWENTQVIQRNSQIEETEEDQEIIFSLTEVIETLELLYVKGDDSIHPNNALRAGLLLGLYHGTGETQLTRGLFKRVIQKFDDKEISSFDSA